MHIHSYFIGWRLVKCHRALAKRIKFGKRYDILNLTCHAILKTRAQWQRLMETKKSQSSYIKCVNWQTNSRAIFKLEKITKCCMNLWSEYLKSIGFLGQSWRSRGKRNFPLYFLFPQFYTNDRNLNLVCSSYERLTCTSRCHFKVKRSRLVEIWQSRKCAEMRNLQTQWNVPVRNTIRWEPATLKVKGKFACLRVVIMSYTRQNTRKLMTYRESNFRRHEHVDLIS